MRNIRNDFLKSGKLFLIIMSIITIDLNAYAISKKNKIGPKGISLGLKRERLYNIYPKDEIRTYRKGENEEWITYSCKTCPNYTDLVTFHFINDKIVEWTVNDRAEIVKEYMSEFVSKGFGEDSLIFSAIRNALIKIPADAFIVATDRKHPIIFTEYHSTGTGKYANSGYVVTLEDDPPTFQFGFYIIKLNTELEAAFDVQEIEGIIYHEIAHRILEHSREDKYLPEFEREANNLIRIWGFGTEYMKAKNRFGSEM